MKSFYSYQQPSVLYRNVSKNVISPDLTKDRIKTFDSDLKKKIDVKNICLNEN